MNTKLIVALACGAALALGACSGGGAPATPATPGPSGPGTGPTDPGTDTRTAAQTAFDTALAAAEKALADARAAVTRAVADANAADTDAKRSAAQTLIEAAREALAKALRDANALSAPDDDYDRLGQAAIQVDKATEAQTEDLGKLRTAEGETGWSGGALLSRAVPRTTVDATRTARKTVDDTTYTDDGADLATALKAADLKPVMYAANKFVMRPGAGSSGDELRMRGFPMRWSHPSSGLQDDAGSTITTVDNAFFDTTFGGLKITPSGLVIRLATISAIPAADLKIDVDGVAQTVATNRYDLALTFGRPSASPTGSAEHYWAAAIMPTSDQVTNAAALKDGTQTLPIGTYSLRMSSHLGVDRNLEDPDDPAASARDDTNSYLSYAAYGLFDFVPLSTLTATANPRVFPFAVGYDAFKDADGMKVTDTADADKITAGKFKGRTIAEEVKMTNSADGNKLLPPGATGGGLQLRGDIELTATISGTASDNAVSGTISNLESWDAKGYWENYAHFTTVALESSGSIGADGSFNGVVTDPDGDSGDDFETGFYKGNFYGPLSDLEAAGTWFVASGVLGTSTTETGILGSFGAARVHDYGKANERYGHVVESGGN